MSESKELAMRALEAALTKNAQRPVLLEVTSLCSYADYILVLGGRSLRQTEAIAEAVEVGLKARGHDPIGREGQRGGQWVLIDFGDVVVHVFNEAVRDYYDLEGLWVEADRVELPPAPERAAQTAG